MLRFCLIICAFSLALSISIPLTSERQRCMVVYTPSSDDFLKLDMKFDRFAGQSKQEGYRITLTNSQTKSSEFFDVQQGTFRKEIQLTENVVYRLCIKIVLDRYGGKPVEQNVEYNSGVKHLTNMDVGNITVPANLLRFKDLQESYKILVAMESMQSLIQTAAGQYLKDENAVFVQQQEEVKKLQWLTFLEFAAICIFGTYQYIRLKGIIQNAPK